MTILVIDNMAFSAPEGSSKVTVYTDYSAFLDVFSEYSKPPEREVIKQYFVDKGYTKEHAFVIDINRGK